MCGYIYLCACVQLSLHANGYTLIIWFSLGLIVCLVSLLSACMRMCVCVCECVCLPVSVCYASCKNFFSKSSDQVKLRQPVTEAGISLGLPLSVHPARQAQELKHMRKLNRHPNSLPYTKQFKWYSLERWQVLMSLSVLQRGRERAMERRREGMDDCFIYLFLFSHQLFASSVSLALRRGAHQCTPCLNKRRKKCRCKEPVCLGYTYLSGSS